MQRYHQHHPESRIQMEFHGFDKNYIVQVCKKAQEILNKANPDGIFAPTPFVSATADGCKATFHSEKLANLVNDIANKSVFSEVYLFMKPIGILVDLAKTLIGSEGPEGPEGPEGLEGPEGPESVDFYLQFSEDPQDPSFLHFFGECQSSVNQLKICFDKLYEEHIVEIPIILVLELIKKIPVKLNEDDIMLIACGQRTLILSQGEKADEFNSHFRRLYSSVITTELEFKGKPWFELKGFCKEIEMKGIFYSIINDKVILKGLPNDIKMFSDALKKKISGATNTSTRIVKRN